VRAPQQTLGQGTSSARRLITFSSAGSCSPRFLHDGLLCMPARARCVRQNRTFTGSDEGGRGAAAICTRLPSSIRSPTVLARDCRDHPAKRTGELLPLDGRQGPDGTHDLRYEPQISAGRKRAVQWIAHATNTRGEIGRGVEPMMPSVEGLPSGLFARGIRCEPSAKRQPPGGQNRCVILPSPRGALRRLGAFEPALRRQGNRKAD
jgi:hypothetical protein